MLISSRPAPLGRTHRALLMTLFASAAFAPAAASASGQQILADCAAGTLAASYPLDDYRDALESMPADMAEYTTCPTEIKASRDRMLAPAGGSGKATSRAKTAAYGAAAPASSPAAGAAEVSVPAAPEAATADDDTDAGSGRKDEPNETTPRTSPQSGPQQDATTDEDFYAVPIAGTGGGDSSGGSGDGGGGVPVIPAGIAFSLIALTGARALLGWGRRPEGFADEQGLDVGPA